jgi:hypothetical protein
MGPRMQYFQLVRMVELVAWCYLAYASSLVMVLGSTPEASQIYHFHKKLIFQQQQKQQRSLTSSARVSQSVSQVRRRFDIQDSGQPSCSQPPARSASSSCSWVQYDSRNLPTDDQTGNLRSGRPKRSLCRLDNRSAVCVVRTTGAQFVSSDRPESSLCLPDDRVAICVPVDRCDRWPSCRVAALS